MGPSEGPPPPIRWPFETLPVTEKKSESSDPSTQTDPASLLDEEGDSSSPGSSPDHPVEGESAYLAFVGHHPTLTLQAGELPPNTSGPRSASPQIVAAPLVASQGQSVEPETAKVEEQVRPSAQRASLALPRVSVKSRIAAFENKSPTASTFGPSPPRPGNVDPVSRNFPVSPKKQEETRALADTTRDLDVTRIDLSETNFPSLPPSVHAEAVTRAEAVRKAEAARRLEAARRAAEARRAPQGGFGFPSSVARDSATRSTPKSEAAETVSAPPTASPKECTPLRAPPKPRLRSTAQSLQAPSPSPETEPPLVTTSALASSELPEQPRTPRLGNASLALPIRSKGVGGERSFPEISRPQTRLQIPSFGWRLPSGSPLERVKHNEAPGPRPRPEDALARQNRFKPQSRLSQVIRAESPEKESPALAQTEPSPFDDNDSDRLFLVPEGYFDIERSSSTHRNRAATLRSLEGLETVEEQSPLSKTSKSSLGEDFGRSTERFSQTALIPRPLKSSRTAAAGPEAKDLAHRQSISTGADTYHSNVSNFRFPFDTAQEKGPDTVEEVQRKRKPTLLPSVIPRLGYSSPPSTPRLPEAEAQTYKFCIPPLEGASVSDFDKPSRRQAVIPTSPIRYPRYPLSSGPYTEPPFLGHPHQLHPLGPTRTWWPSVTGEQPASLAAPDEHNVLPLESEVKLLQFQHQQQAKESGSGRYGFDPLHNPCRSTESSPKSSPESSETPTPRQTEARVQYLEVPVPEDPEEIIPRITRTLIQHHLRPSDSESESGSDIMDHLRPESALAVSHHRREAMRLAKAQETSVIEKCRRSGASVPEYAFDELIGKGSFGRVYKCRNTTTRDVVAVKVIDIDESDYRAHGEEKDEQIRAFQKEIKILRQAQESGAPNLNQMIEALPVHSQLWLVCEYCPGGSVKTLMRATNDKLIERYIVVIARELGKALKGLHAAGILHRDIKAANVLIHEEGRLQLCDFGVATVIETKLDKRRTFIGTLHWMPPEMWDQKPEYSDEVDVWAFGCVIYECAMGKPPNSDLREPQQLKSRMRRLNKPIELPESEDFPEALRSLVSYTLTPDVKNRPSMRDVLEHEYLADTEESHPTGILTELVNVYYTWLHGGGQRASLFIKGGAVVSDAPGALSTSDDEWNFSTTVDFEKRISTILDIDIDIPEITDSSDFQSTEGEATPKAVQDPTLEPQGRELTEAQKANFEARVRRGADLSNVFDLNKPDYEYKTKTDFRPIQERRVSDLPLRVMAEDRPPSIASNEIDLGDFDSSNYATVAPLTKLIDASTIRAKRDDLKLSRENSATKAIPNINVFAAEDNYLAQQEPTDRPATQDFSFPPKEWKQDKIEGLATKLDDTKNVYAKKSSVRKTMEWSFDTAMSETESEEPEPEPAITEDSRAKKHATMQWSFPQAMAEAGASSTPSVTPARPAPMLRTITMPVTSSEIDAAEADVPRPSTAMSETVSETSLASSEADPFGLDQDAHGYPAPSALDQRGISSYYHSEGDTLSPEHTVPYNTTVAGPAPYPMGPPARIGEEGFPGPSTTVAAAAQVAQSGKKQKKKRRFTRSRKEQSLASDGEAPTTSSSPESASPGTPGARQRVTMPEIVPPTAEALDVNATPEQLERELGSMLGSFGSVLSAAGRVMGIGRSRRGSRRRSSSEWESEE